MLPIGLGPGSQTIGLFLYQFFFEAIPGVALGTLPHPAWENSGTFLADKLLFDFGHRGSHFFGVYYSITDADTIKGLQDFQIVSKPSGSSHPVPLLNV